MEDFKKLGRPDGVPARTQVLIGPGRSGSLSPYLPTPANPEPEALLFEYYRLLLRHRWLIGVFVAAGATLALLLCLMTRPVYRARTSLDIQNLNVDFLNMRAIAPTGMAGPAQAEVYIQTEIKLLQSDSLINRTKKKMEESAKNIKASNGGLLSQVRQALHLPGSEAPSVRETLDYTAKSLVVKPMGLTHLVEITCDAWDAQFAADFCNGISTEFQQQDREVRWSEAQKTSEWLSRQLADVRDQLSTSEKRLERASQADGLLFSQQQNGSVGEQKLRELQTELMKAQADRVARQAQYEISKSATPDSLPIVLDDTQLRDYQTKLVELKRQLADLMPPLTDAHPKVQHVKAQIRELEGTLASKKVNVIDRMQNEFEAARHRENLLTSAYVNQEKRVALEMGRETQVNMLRRDVDSGQQLYQTLSQRVKEAGLASAMQATTIRTVDVAAIPEIPILPKKVQTIISGILLGSIAGICFAFFKDRTQTLLQTPGEAPRYLNVRELGVIPSARVGLSQAYIQRIKQAPASGTSLMLPGATIAGTQLRTDQVVDLATWKAHASLVAEAYRSATYSILLEGEEAGRGKAYVITSPSAGEGKTSVTCNLGIALAQANRRVLVIDGDLRRPRLHKSMAIPNTCGLRDVLRGDAVFEGPVDRFCHPSQVPNLFILPSGSGNEEPSGLLHSSRLRPLLKRLTEEFDVVLIDSPPVLHLADARILAGATDGVILVLRARSTDRETAMNARNLFQHDQVRIVGTILNDFDPLSQGRSSYYDSYYKYAELKGKESGELNHA